MTVEVLRTVSWEDSYALTFRSVPVKNNLRRTQDNTVSESHKLHETIIAEAMKLASANACNAMASLCLRLAQAPDLPKAQRAELIIEAHRWRAHADAKIENELLWRAAVQTQRKARAIKYNGHHSTKVPVRTQRLTWPATTRPTA